MTKWNKTSDGVFEAAFAQPITAQDLDSDRLRIDLKGVPVTGNSYTAYICANEAAPGAPDAGKIDSISVFGHGACAGGEGHCENRERAKVDPRAPFHGKPVDLQYDLTGTARRYIQKNGPIMKLRLVDAAVAYPRASSDQVRAATGPFARDLAPAAAPSLSFLAGDVALKRIVPRQAVARSEDAAGTARSALAGPGTLAELSGRVADLGDLVVGLASTVRALARKRPATAASALTSPKAKGAKAAKSSAGKAGAKVAAGRGAKATKTRAAKKRGTPAGVAG